jgi:hypothetical protein
MHSGYYQRLIIKCLVSWLLILGGQRVARAQSTCNQTLIKAQIAYYEGRASEVPAILNACLTDGFSREEKVQAYYLLTLTHLYLNETINAEHSLLDFLRLNPEYQIKEDVDPMEFINLYKQFRTWPVYLIGIKPGGNFTFVHPVRYFSTDNLQTMNGFYTSRLQFQTSLHVEIPLNGRFSFAPELLLANRSYNYNTRLFSYVNVDFVERQMYLETPMVFIWHLRNSGWRPYLNGGISVGQLWSARAQVRRTDINLANQSSEPNSDIRREVTGPDVSLNAQRKFMQLSPLLGAGIKYKKGRNTLLLDVRYSVALLNAVKSRKRYTNPELIYRYGYLDNDFRMSSISISLGYLIPIYKPKVLRRNETSDASTE